MRVLAEGAEIEIDPESGKLHIRRVAQAWESGAIINPEGLHNQQMGAIVQAIGGVNEKIEGFFDVCRQRGLDGKQGVLVPAANVKHLMLRQDVVDACAEGKFHVIPIESIDQGIEILTGAPAGEPDVTGRYPEGTINQRVAVRLAAFASRAARQLPPRRRERPARKGSNND